MKTLTYIIQDPVGLHARPASKVVQQLTKFSSKVTLKLGPKSANAKSMINLMALGIKHKDKVIFEIEGTDEESLLSELPEILKTHNI